MAATAVKPEIRSAVGVRPATKVVLIVEYDGTRYHGYQLQGTLPTIQLEMEKAVKALTGETSRVVTASRTDTGVHARAQVVSFRTHADYQTDIFVRALNHYLPEDISVKEAWRTADNFDVRRRAVSREYTYTILNSSIRSPLRDRFCHRVPGELDMDMMNSAARILIGTHDFVSFVSNREAAARATVRRVQRAEWERHEDTLVFTMKANSFLMHQVRNTVGVLIKVGRGKVSPEEFSSILEAKQPGLAWPAAPASGLCLMQVNYAKPIKDE